MSKVLPRNQLDLFSDDSMSGKTGVAASAKPSARCFRCSECFLSDREVAKRYDVSRASIWRWLANEPLFPAPVKLSAGTSRWKLGDLVQFEATLPIAKRKERASSKSGTAG